MDRYFESDTVCCEGLDFLCNIGFHDYELASPQQISIDLRVDVPRPEVGDHVENIIFDYYIANEKIRAFLQGKRFNLIETLASEVAEMLLAAFSIQRVFVRVNKFPKDMPNAKRVAYECIRSRA